MYIPKRKSNRLLHVSIGLMLWLSHRHTAALKIVKPLLSPPYSGHLLCAFRPIALPMGLTLAVTRRPSDNQHNRPKQNASHQKTNHYTRDIYSLDYLHYTHIRIYLYAFIIILQQNRLHILYSKRVAGLAIALLGGRLQPKILFCTTDKNTYGSKNVVIILGD